MTRCLTALAAIAWVTLAAANAAAGPSIIRYKDASYVDRHGQAWTCHARHRKTGELVPAKGVKMPLFPSLSGVIYDGAGHPIIVFSALKMDHYPPIFELFVYHHECAHLTVPTTDEIVANCEALIAMRRTGNITPALEETLRDIHYGFGDTGPFHGGDGRSFWNATVECAETPLGPTQ